MKTNIKISHLFIFMVAFNSCKPSLDVPTPSAGDADFSKTIAIGGDFLSGYQNDALSSHSQQRSVAALLTQQFLLVGGNVFQQSLNPYSYGIGINNKPWEYQYNTASILGFKTDCQNLSDFFPLKNSISSGDVSNYLSSNPGNSITDFSIPFAHTSDFFNLQFGSSTGSIYYHHFASSPGTTSIYDDAQKLNPTFTILWLGMEDIYDYARNGGKDLSIPSSTVFENYLDSILKKFSVNGNKGVIANIPDWNSFPFYTLVPPRGLTLTLSQADSLNQLTGLQIYNVGENGFFIEYPKSSGNYRQMGNGESLLLDIPLDSLKCNSMGVIQPIPDRYELDSMEVSIIHLAVTDYNKIIQSKATQYNLAFVDMNSFFKSVNSGIKWNGADVNADFVSGGFFSLDGYHPHEQGYAIIANKFLEAINSKYNCVIPWINCNDCDGVKFP